MLKIAYGAGIINFYGEILAYSIDSTVSQVEEKADKVLVAGWDKHKELGDRISALVIIELGSKEDMIKSLNLFLDKRRP